jgi:galactokinase
MTGGGFGGAAIALIDSSKVASLTAALLEIFNNHGFEKPEIFKVTADEGARREI